MNEKGKHRACLGVRLDATKDEAGSKAGKVGVQELWTPLCLIAWSCGAWAACLTVYPVGIWSFVSLGKAYVTPGESTS